MKRAHHALELAHRTRRRFRRRKGPLRREIAEAVVAPVIGEAFLFEVPVVRMVMNRHQLHRGHAELAQMLERRLSRERFVGAALMLGDVGMQLREPFDVQLVDDRVVPRREERPIVAPRKRRIDHRGQRRVRCVVAIVERQVFPLVADAVPEHLVAPSNRTRDRFRVWIHDNFVRVESVAVLRLVRPVDAITVELVRARVGQKAVPHLVGLLGQLDCGRFFRGVRRVEQAKLDLGCVR